MTLELHAVPEEVMRAVAALQDFARSRQLPEPTVFALALALEECASNIVNHALERDPQRTFQVSFEQVEDTFIIELRDRGPAFDPTQAAASPAYDEGDATVGGWGLTLVRRCTDDIAYTREGAENVLRLSRHLGQAAEAKAFRKPQNHQHVQTKEHAMPLEIQMLKSLSPADSGAITVKLSGSLDTATAPELERQLAPVLAEPVKDLVFDLAELKFISSAGLRVFANTRKTLKERGGQASFVHLQPQIQEVFEIIKSLPGVAIFKDVAELDRYLTARQLTHETHE